jgi:catechol 2,3-dioxygenase-like lactoylglutathione lyase family enzyme
MKVIRQPATQDLKFKRGNLQHLEINVSNIAKSKRFYDALLNWMGYKHFLEHNLFAGWENGQTKIFLTTCFKEYKKAGFHRRRVGLNHFAFWAESNEDVDRFYKQFLLRRKIRILYGGPKMYPEYSPSYYAVYFEDPDRIKLEYVHQEE